MFLLEDVGQIILWIAVLIGSLNLVFFFFLLHRRLARKRYFIEKDAARERYRDVIDGFAVGQLPLEQVAGVLADAKSRAEREVVYQKLFAAANPNNTKQISDLLFLLGFVEEWAKAAFPARAARRLIKASLSGDKEWRVSWPKLFMPIYRMRLTAVNRALAMNNLGRLSPRHAHPFLCAGLQDPSAQVRRVAIENMGRNRYPDAVPLLVEELQKAVEERNDLSLRSLKAALIGYRLEDLEQFLPFLTSQNRRSRFFVIDAIRQICEKAAQKSRLTKNDFSPNLCRAVLEHCQFDEFEDVRARSAYVVKYFRDQTAIDMLRGLLQDKNEFVRLHALRACSERFYADLIPEVIARLTDERWRVREAAVQALHAMGPRGRQTLFHFFIECSDQFAAEQACDEFQREGIVPELLATMAAGGDDGLLAENVARKMVSMGKTSLLTSMLTSSDSFAVRVALMDTLAINPTSEFVSALNAISAENSGQISSKARQVLQRIQSGSNIRFGSGSTPPEKSKGTHA
jgi:HEAT repeat protein